MITFRHKGDFSKATNYLEKIKHAARISILDKYGKEGVAALASATPVDSGKTAESWEYEIVYDDKGVSITFINTNVNKGVNIAIILQTGHGTGTGGWVQGIDYINPAIRPIFNDIANKVWEEVTKI